MYEPDEAACLTFDTFRALFRDEPATLAAIDRIDPPVLLDPPLLLQILEDFADVAPKWSDWSDERAREHRRDCSPVHCWPVARGYSGPPAPWVGHLPAGTHDTDPPVGTAWAIARTRDLERLAQLDVAAYVRIVSGVVAGGRVCRPARMHQHAPTRTTLSRSRPARPRSLFDATAFGREAALETDAGGAR